MKFKQSVHSPPHFFSLILPTIFAFFPLSLSLRRRFEFRPSIQLSGNGFSNWLPTNKRNKVSPLVAHLSRSMQEHRPLTFVVFGSAALHCDFRNQLLKLLSNAACSSHLFTATSGGALLLNTAANPEQSVDLNSKFVGRKKEDEEEKELLLFGASSGGKRRRKRGCCC